MMWQKPAVQEGCRIASNGGRSQWSGTEVTDPMHDGLRKFEKSEEFVKDLWTFMWGSLIKISLWC